MESTNAMIYLEVNLIGIILSVLILLRIREERDYQTSNTALIRVAVAIVVILVLDALWALLEGHPSGTLRVVNYFINVSYMFLTGLIPYLWMKFVICRLGRSIDLTRLHKLLLLLPLAMLFILCIFTPWTHWLFEINESNVYQRGTLHFLQPIPGYIYTISTSIFALICAKREPLKEKKTEALTLCSFAILPTLGGVASIMVFGLPTIWPFTTVSLTMIYMNMQSWQISTDSLTGLNNRRQFDKYLRTQVSERHRDGVLNLILLDIDDFKKINDTFGHAVGDRALISAATILKQLCGGMSAFLARYGGDEFAIVLETRSPGEASKLIKSLSEAVKGFNDNSGEKYSLNFSAGICALSEEISTPLAMIEQADMRLYENKSERRKRVKS